MAQPSLLKALPFIRHLARQCFEVFMSDNFSFYTKRTAKRKQLSLICMKYIAKADRFRELSRITDNEFIVYIKTLVRLHLEICEVISKATSKADFQKIDVSLSEIVVTLDRELPHA